MEYVQTIDWHFLCDFRSAVWTWARSRPTSWARVSRVWLVSTRRSWSVCWRSTLTAGSKPSGTRPNRKLPLFFYPTRRESHAQGQSFKFWILTFNISDISILIDTFLSEWIYLPCHLINWFFLQNICCSIKFYRW